MDSNSFQMHLATVPVIDDIHYFWEYLGWTFAENQIANSKRN